MKMNLDYLLKNTNLKYQDLITIDKGITLEALEVVRRAFPNNPVLEGFYQFKLDRAAGKI
jgi:hypothetical protein